MSMKNKLLLGVLVVAVTAAAFLTKHNTTRFFMDSRGELLNYGFPFRTVLVTPDNTLEHIYTGNIIINILLSLPIFISAVLSCVLKLYRKTNNILIIFFSSGVIISLFMPWHFRVYSFTGMLILYGLWYIWLIFILWNISHKRGIPVK